MASKSSGNALSADQRAHNRQWWEHAVGVRQHVIDGGSPSPINVWDLPRNADETFFYDTTANYSRFYGQQIQYTQTGGLFLGNPFFVLAGVGATAIGNARRRNQAWQLAAEQWRDHAQCRLVVSDQRLICQVGPNWLNFWYGAIVAIYPSPDDWCLLMQFGDTSPLLLHSPAMPAVSVVTLLATMGRAAVADHPAMQSMNFV